MLSDAKNRRKSEYEEPPEMALRKNGKWRFGYDLSGAAKDWRNLSESGRLYGIDGSNTRSCILSTFDQLVRLFKASPALTDMLSESTFELGQIGLRKNGCFSYCTG